MPDCLSTLHWRNLADELSPLNLGGHGCYYVHLMRTQLNVAIHLDEFLLSSSISSVHTGPEISRLSKLGVSAAH